jgi:hypothetical protein
MLEEMLGYTDAGHAMVAAGVISKYEGKVALV